MPRLKRLLAVSFGLAIFVIQPTLAIAQLRGDMRGRRVRDNYYRDIGGSCIYGRDGKVVYAPKGATCRTPDSSSDTAAEDAPASLEKVPPELQSQVDQLIGQHERFAEALTQLLKRIEARKYKAAAKLLDGLKTDLADHERREEQLFERITSSPAATP